MAKPDVKELKSLMNFLDEQEEPVFAQISEHILSHGVAAIPYLEAYGEKNLSNIVHVRIKTLIHKIRMQNLYFELHNWATLNSDDLLKGYFIASKYLFPDLDEEKVMEKVDALKKEVWLELKKDMTPFEEAKVISKIFFEVKKFSFNANESAMPDCLCLNAALNSGKAHPDAFVLLYAGIAQRLNLPIYGNSMPGIIFLPYVYTENRKGVDLKKDVQFYLNPFAAGAFFTNSQINDLMTKCYPDEFEKFVGACTNPVFLSRILKQMRLTFKLTHKPEKAEDIQTLLKALVVE